MNRPLIIILILIFLAFIFLAARWFSPKLCAPSVAAAPAASNGIWAFDDGKTFNQESSQYYRFKRNNFNNVPGTTESFKSTIGNTVNYLKKNGSRALTVTGLYAESEKYSGNAGNLGLARANDIKKSLIKDGVPADQIVTESLILREDLFRKDTIQRGAYFTFFPKAGKANTIARSATSFMAGAAPALAGTKLIGKDMIIYFGLNKAALNLSSRDKQDMKDIKAYMDATPSAKLQVSGHTDNRGSATTNKTLSRKRAKFASEQLSKRYGIPLNRMNVVGYGEERPIDNSDTEAGWKKNRRVEIRLNK